MKFEKPIAEIDRFDLRDVISSSSGSPADETGTPETQSPETTLPSAYGTEVWYDNAGPCTGYAQDMYDKPPCMYDPIPYDPTLPWPHP